MKKDDLGKLYPIEVIEYDPDWTIQFDREAYTDKKAGYIKAVTELVKREIQETTPNGE